MQEKAQLILEGKTYDLPIIEGTEKEKAIDISSLRGSSSYITLDNGFGNTGACTSAITFLDGEKGILRYRGIPIEQIAEQSTFVETSYLLIEGSLAGPRKRLITLTVPKRLIKKVQVESPQLTWISQEAK